MPNDCCKTEIPCRESASQPCTDTCPCGGSCGGDPMACARALWCSSFGEALRQAHVEALKTRIQKAWGAQIDKGADAVVEAMGTIWMSKLAEAKAKSDLQAKMAALMSQAK